MTAIQTWVELNAVLVDVTDEVTLHRMLKEELRRGPPRQQFLLRIHSRLNKVRASRERLELLAQVKGCL